MELKANERKIINTQPLDYLFTQGESGVDRISIILPLQYGQVDLSALRWSIQLVSEQDTFISKPLLSEIGPENLTVYWEVDGDCTAVAGKISLTVVGISDDGSEVIKFDGREIMVKAALYGNFVPTPDTLAASLAQVQKYTQEAALTAKQAESQAVSAEKFAQEAKTAAKNGPLIGENGHWFLYDVEAGVHLDSGVSVYGTEGKSPYIGTDGYWYQWNQEEGIYQKTDILAQGPVGVAGGVATVNGKLPDETGNVEVASGGGDIINGVLTVWQRYNAADSSTYTNPSAKYVADRFRTSGTGTIRPNPRGYGADITGSITVQYWMEPEDFALLPDPVEVYYSVDGQMEKISTAKGAVPTDSGKNACVFQRMVTNATLDWVSLYPKRPVRPYSEELVLCQRYTVIYPAKNGNIVMFTGNPLGDTTKFRFVAQLPAVMRTKPTASGKYLSAAAMMNPAEISHPLNSVSVTADAGSSLMIDAVTDSLTEKTLYALRIVDGGYILFDAEIY